MINREVSIRIVLILLLSYIPYFIYFRYSVVKSLEV